MTCSDFQELLVVQAEGILDERQAAALADHMRSCPACRAEAECILQLHERLVSDGRLFADARPDGRVMDRILQESAPNLRRTNVMRSNATRWSLAAAFVAAVVALVIVFAPGRSGSLAYALEQTVAAYHGVRSMHLKVEAAGNSDVEAWAEFGDDGSLLRLRMDWPQSEDGPKDLVWEKGKAQIWFKDKKHVAVVREPDMLAKIARSFPDPKLAVQDLYEAQTRGEAGIEVEEPTAEGVIRLTVTKPGSTATREVWLVDARTKLLKELQRQELRGSEYKTLARLILLDYNKPIEPALFALNVPKDVMVIDQTTQEVGLARGDMSENQIAVKVVRSFFEAMIAGDFATAGRLYEGLPAAKLQEAVTRTKFLRIDSIGEPTPDADPRTGALRVPCKVQIEEDGVRWVQDFTPRVRQVYNQPDRWTISGGI
jgi:hypothetical protein